MSYCLLISQETARRYFADEDPIGKYIETGGGWNGVKYGGEVIGVVGDVLQHSLAGQGASHLYMHESQAVLNEYSVVIRGSVPVPTVLTAACGILRSLDADVPMIQPRAISDLVDASLGHRRFYLTLLASFAVVAWLLAVVGVYGVIAYCAGCRAIGAG